ncbi:hypothetical protein AGMMS49531_03580 [Endomicrobiia bacterium]|nr:hypothetical protein AGMMS49531_03580 [Endomicrobiia bacterium]
MFYLDLCLAQQKLGYPEQDEAELADLRKYCIVCTQQARRIEPKLNIFKY